MFLFLRLLLAHFIGDFFLQTKEVYKARRLGLWGASIHYLVVFLSLLAFSLPYLKYIGCWVAIIFATATHIVQDELKLKTKSGRSSFIAFIIDQLLHIVFLSPILLFSFAYTPPGAHNTIAVLYNNTPLQLVLLGYIVSIFTGAYLWIAFTASYGKKYQDIYH